MKRHQVYEALGMITALLGALLLVVAFFPILNPGRHRLETGHSGEPLGYYLITVAIATLVLSAAWYFNRKAQRLKREEKPVHDKRSA